MIDYLKLFKLDQITLTLRLFRNFVCDSREISCSKYLNFLSDLLLEIVLVSSFFISVERLSPIIFVWEFFNLIST